MTNKDVRDYSHHHLQQSFAHYRNSSF